jgi:hypothetical protein
VKLTDDQLQAIAERMRWERIRPSLTAGLFEVWPRGVRDDDSWHRYSEGDLLLTILNKAAGMGYDRKSECLPGAPVPYYVRFGKDKPYVRGRGESLTSELEATVLAFIQLPTRSAGG